MNYEELAKENEGKQATDEEFARGIGIYFYIDVPTETVHTEKSSAYRATNLEISMWEQLRHAYGFEVSGTCNSKHMDQWDREQGATVVKVRQ